MTTAVSIESLMKELYSGAEWHFLFVRVEVFLSLSLVFFSLCLFALLKSCPRWLSETSHDWTWVWIVCVSMHRLHGIFKQAASPFQRWPRGASWDTGLIWESNKKDQISVCVCVCVLCVCVCEMGIPMKMQTQPADSQTRSGKQATLAFC